MAPGTEGYAGVLVLKDNASFFAVLDALDQFVANHDDLEDDELTVTERERRDAAAKLLDEMTAALAGEETKA